MTTAVDQQEAEATLAEHQADLTRTLGELRGRISALTAEHGDALIGGRIADAEAAAAELETLTPRLERIAAKLTAVESAISVLTGKRRRRETEQRLAAAQAQQQVDMANARAAGERVEALLAELKEAIRAGHQADAALTQTTAEVHEATEFLHPTSRVIGGLIHYTQRPQRRGPFGDYLSRHPQFFDELSRLRH
jgi:DNA repair exonuclease SbcCD ATPase subunit